jgi:rfaE bifunctional protein kinase chain/domain
MLQKTVLVTGHFNIVHPGHHRLLRFARQFGKRLIIAVESDRIAGDAAHIPESMRLEGIQSIGYIDDAFIMDESIEITLEKLKPDVVVKGKEHENRFNPELDILKKWGGKLIFSSGEVVFSSLDLIRKEFEVNEGGSIKLPINFFIRHNLVAKKLADLVQHFSNLKVCVIGDLIVDEYVTCDPVGMSQEDPTIVVMPINSTRFIGGAGIVAAHAAGLGASVSFISVTGNDQIREYAINALEKYNVSAHLLIDETRPTTLKQRFRSKGKSLLRVSHLHQGAISKKLQDEMITIFEENIAKVDLIIFSDFNYGCLPQYLVEKLIYLAKKNTIFTAADSQSSSQVGDISRFKGVDLITPTEREARISTRNHEDGLVVLAEQVRLESLAKNVLLKMGEEGVLIHASNEDRSDWLTDRVEALNSMPKDVAGAGDSLLTVSSMTLACGGDIWSAACLGSLAAAHQVGRVGNTPLTADELLKDLV